MKEWSNIVIHIGTDYKRIQIGQLFLKQKWLQIQMKKNWNKLNQFTIYFVYL